MFSQRTNWSFDKNPLIERLEFFQERKKQIIDLTESNPTRCGFSFPEDKILRALGNSKNMVYEPLPKGKKEAREAICAFYHRRGIRLDPRQILLTASTSEAYSYVFRLLLNPNEEVLAARPSYPLLEYLAQLNDVRRSYYSLVYCQDRWAVDLSSLERGISSDTRCIILVNPNNPTGSFIRQDELARINDLCEKNHLALICDEVFSDYRFEEDDPGSVLSCMVNPQVLTFSFQGISKSLGLPQMKIGWMVVSGPEGQKEKALECLEMIADTYLSVNTPVVHALGEWLSLAPLIQEKISRHLKANKKYLQQALFPVPSCRCYHIQGGWYAILELPQERTEDQWAMDFLEKESVFVHPGYFFDFEKGCHVILSLLVQPEVFQEGVRRILKRVERCS